MRSPLPSTIQARERGILYSIGSYLSLRAPRSLREAAFIVSMEGRRDRFRLRFGASPPAMPSHVSFEAISHPKQRFAMTITPVIARPEITPTQSRRLYRELVQPQTSNRKHQTISFHESRIRNHGFSSRNEGDGCSLRYYKLPSHMFKFLRLPTIALATVGSTINGEGTVLRLNTNFKHKTLNSKHTFPCGLGLWAVFPSFSLNGFRN
jgi:hypothetical protein